MNFQKLYKDTPTHPPAYPPPLTNPARKGRKEVVDDGPLNGEASEGMCVVCKDVCLVWENVWNEWKRMKRMKRREVQ